VPYHLFLLPSLLPPTILLLLQPSLPPSLPSFHTPPGFAGGFLLLLQLLLLRVIPSSFSFFLLYPSLLCFSFFSSSIFLLFLFNAIFLVLLFIFLLLCSAAGLPLREREGGRDGWREGGRRKSSL